MTHLASLVRHTAPSGPRFAASFAASITAADKFFSPSRCRAVPVCRARVHLNFSTEKNSNSNGFDRRPFCDFINTNPRATTLRGHVTYFSSRDSRKILNRDDFLKTDYLVRGMNMSSQLVSFYKCPVLTNTPILYSST